MRRFLAAIALASMVITLGAYHRRSAPPPPAPTPSPTPTPSPASLMPTVIIYPFQVNGDAEKSAGAKLATLFSNEITSEGGITLKAPAANVSRSDYLTNAVRNGADYYVSGYITPMGDEVALVEQVVSTQSGAIIWGNTAHVLTYGDATAQAGYIHAAVVSHAGRVEASYRGQQPAATPTPGPSNGASTSIGRLLGLLHHGPSSKAAVAADQKPSAPVYVPTVGNASALSASLARSLQRAYNVSRSAISSSNVAADARAICGTTQTASIATGGLQSFTGGFPRTTKYNFTLRVYRCDGTVFYTHTATANSQDEAIDSAVDSFSSAYPRNV